MAGQEFKRERGSGRILISSRLQGTSVSEVGMLAGWGVLHVSSPFTYKHLFGCFLFCCRIVVVVLLFFPPLCHMYYSYILHCNLYSLLP